MTRRSSGSRSLPRGDSLGVVEENSSERRTNGDTPTSTQKKKRPSRPTDWNNLPANFAFRIDSHPVGQSRKRKRGPATELEQSNPWDSKLNTHYTVHPAKAWEDTSRFRKFTLQGETFSAGDNILVSQSDGTTDASIANWVAHVLEVRAGDEQHVYLRVFWLYRPEDLPGGRKSYHGRNEIIASNHMEIIDAMTCNGAANVINWKENEDNSETLDPDQIFWRQTYNCHTGELSTLPKYCIDSTPYNPDTTLVGCTNPSCNGWFHASCLEQDAIKQAYKRNNLIFSENGESESVNMDDSTPVPESETVTEHTSPMKKFTKAISGFMKLTNGTATSLQGSRTPSSPIDSSPASKRVKTRVSDTATTDDVTAASLSFSQTPPQSTLESKSGSEPLNTAELETMPSEDKIEEMDSDTEMKVSVVDVQPSRTEEKSSKFLFSAKLVTPTAQDEKTKIEMEDLRPGHSTSWDETVKCLTCGSAIA